MKNNLKLLSLIFAAGALASCSTAQKTAKVDTPLPTRISYNNETAENQYKLGRHFQNTQRLDEAFVAYQKSLILNPNNTQASIALAVLYAERGHYQISISELKELTAKSPDDASLYNNLGYVYYLNGNYNEAVATLDKAIAIDHNNVHALNNMAAALNKLGKADRAYEFTVLAKSIKKWGIRPAADSQTMITSNDVEATAGTSLPAFAGQLSTELSGSFQNPATLTTTESNTQTEIKQISSSVYEVVKTEVVVPQQTQIAATVAVITTQEVTPTPELRIAQSGGVSYKVNPLVNKVFDENVLALVNGTELSDKEYRLVIVNGNGVKGFARKVSETLIKLGLTQPFKLADLRRYNQYKTVLQYRSGFRNEAKILGKTLVSMPMLVRNNNMSNGADLRLILGRDIS